MPGLNYCLPTTTQNYFVRDQILENHEGLFNHAFSLPFA
jgi:hypothetical protein